MGYFYLILQDKKTIVGRFNTLTELIKKTGIPSGDVKFRNKEFIITISTSSLDLDPTLTLIVENLAKEGKL